MVNTNKLQGVMKEKRISVQDLAKKIGVSATTLYRIIQNDGKSFTVAQVEIIKEILSLDNAALVEIFFSLNRPKKWEFMRSTVWKINSKPQNRSKQK